jgi:hypothetical protein
MRKAILATAAVLATAAPVYAQSTTGPSSGQTIIRTPASSNGGGSGVSGRIGSPTPTYPGPLRDFNNPSVNFDARFRNPGVPRR